MIAISGMRTVAETCERGRSGLAAVILPVLLLLLTLARPASAQSSDGTREKLLAIAEALRAQQRQIRDISCSVVYSQKGTESPDYIRNKILTLEIIRSRGQISGGTTSADIEALRASMASLPSVDMPERALEWRLRQDGMFWVTQPVSNTPADGVTYLSYDGARYSWYDPARNRGVVNGRFEMPDTNPYFGLNVTGSDMRLDAFLTAAAARGDATCEEEVSQDGTVLSVISAGILAQGPEMTERYAKVWLDPGKGFMPTRIDVGILAGSGRNEQVLTGTIRNLGSRELEPGVWLPVSCTVETHMVANIADPDRPLEEWRVGSFPSTASVSVRLQDIRINQGLRDEDFRIDFPSGTILYDGLVDMRVVKDGVYEAIDAELLDRVGSPAAESTATEAQAVERSSTPIVIPVQESPSAALVMALCLVALAGVAGAAVAAYRRARNRRSTN